MQIMQRFRLTTKQRNWYIADIANAANGDETVKERAYAKSVPLTA